MPDILFAKALESKQASDIVAAVLIIIGVWIYKEVRNSLIEVDKQNADRIDKALLIYGELEVLLLLRRNDNVTDLNQKLANAYPYFEKELIKKAHILREVMNREGIDRFLSDLKVEIMRLKSLQQDPVSTQPSGYFIGEMSSFLNRTKFNSFIQPILFLVVAFILIGVLSAFSLALQKADLYGKIAILILLIEGFFNLLIIANFFDSLFNKRFKHNLKNWLAVVGLVFLPAFLFWITHYHWLVILGDLVFVWVYMAIFLRDSIQRGEE
ncbi:MAG: hypothetical protein P4L59_13515 [Desulfosporosinus sp.]|nr:hypothetical protein [Desulfosporosinus sp.]